MKIKRGLSLVLGLGVVVASALSIVPATNAFAEGEEPLLIGDGDNLYAAFYYGGSYKLANDIDYSSQYSPAIFAMEDTVLDLNGYTLTFDADDEYLLTFGGDVIIKGEGKIQKTVDSNGSPAVWAYGGNTITLESGTIEAVNYPIVVANGSDISTDGGTFVMNGGSVVSGGYGIAAYYNGRVEMNGGIISAGTFALTGNGLAKNAGATFTVNDGTIISERDYAIYMPQVDGALMINNGSVTGAAGAIAVNRGNITITDGILKSLGTAEASGDVAQDGTRGYGNAVIGIAKEYGPVSLSISGGSFVAEGDAELITDPSGLDNDNPATVSISGGMFSAEPEHEYVVNGKDIYQIDEGYIVSGKINLPAVVEPIVLFRGESIDISSKEEFGVRTKYGWVIPDNSGLYVADGTIITAGDTVGKTQYTVNYGGLIYNQEDSYDIEIIDIPEIEVVADEESGVSQAVAVFVAEQIRALIEEGDYVNKNVFLPAIDYVIEMIKSGKAITLSLVTEDAALDFAGMEAGEEISNEIRENEVMVAAYDANLYVFDEEGFAIGHVAELDNGITLEFEIPEGLPEVAEGYKRTFYVIRGHQPLDSYDNRADRLEPTVEGNKLYVESDKFSTFLITYEDTLETDESEAETPNTGAFTKTVDYAKSNKNYAVMVLAAGMVILGYGLISQGQLNKAVRNSKD